jgi:cytochrome c553
MGRFRRSGLAAIATVAWIASANAAESDGRAIAAGCRSCHQPAERTPPALDGQSRAELVEKLRGFRDATRAGTVMPQLVKGYTGAQLEAAAAWFAAQPSVR